DNSRLPRWRHAEGWIHQAEVRDADRRKRPRSHIPSSPLMLSLPDGILQVYSPFVKISPLPPLGSVFRGVHAKLAEMVVASANETTVCRLSACGGAVRTRGVLRAPDIATPPTACCLPGCFSSTSLSARLRLVFSASLPTAHSCRYADSARVQSSSSPQDSIRLATARSSRLQERYCFCVSCTHARPRQAASLPPLAPHILSTLSAARSLPRYLEADDPFGVVFGLFT
ncbi:hypothetical protein C8F04DRAFT_1291374, partial [Mycena alexandri]